MSGPIRETTHLRVSCSNAEFKGMSSVLLRFIAVQQSKMSSFFPGLLKWVEEQSESDSPKLFLESWKILQNLKAHSLKSDVYPEGVYPFIPPWMPQQVINLSLYLL